MEDPMETTPSSEVSEPLDVDSIRSRIRELSEIHSSCNEHAAETMSSDSQKLLRDCALELESKMKQIVEEYSDGALLGVDDLDSYVQHLQQELRDAEAQSSQISEEIEVLSRNLVEESSRLESNLEEINCSLDFVASQGLEKEDEDGCAGCSVERVNELDLINEDGERKFEILELDSQIEKKRSTLKSLQDLDLVCKRLDAVEQMEDLLTGLKVIDFDKNYIRLSLQTYIPKLEGFSGQQRFEDFVEKSEVNHELLIEIMDGSMELKKVEMFPNDVYIGDIVDASKSFRYCGPLLSMLSVLETRSSLLWFVEKVQDRIIFSTLRKVIVKVANTARHSVEYVEDEEMIVAHMVGEIDAFIKVGQGWPLSNSPLKMVSIKSSDHHSKGVSLSLLCKVEERANSLDAHIRQRLSSFVDHIEKLLVEEMRSELQT